MRHGQAVFVDSGAWIALALSRDPLHTKAREHWDLLQEAGAKLHTSVPVVIETFTFLDAAEDSSLALPQFVEDSRFHSKASVVWNSEDVFLPG